MARYAITNQNAASPTLQNISLNYKTLIGVNCSNGTATRRGKVFDVIVGTNGTPANNFMEFDLAQMTAAGTGVASTPVREDQADGNALTVATINYTAEPTVTASTEALYYGWNQQLTYRWQTDPETGIVFPAINLAGYVLRVRSGSYTGTATATKRINEM